MVKTLQRFTPNHSPQGVLVLDPCCCCTATYDIVGPGDTSLKYNWSSQILIDHGPPPLRRAWDNRHHHGVQIRRCSRAHARRFRLLQVLVIRGYRAQCGIRHLAENDDQDNARLPQQLPVPDVRGCRVHNEIRRAENGDRVCAELPQLLPEQTCERNSDH